MIISIVLISALLILLSIVTVADIASATSISPSLSGGSIVVTNPDNQSMLEDEVTISANLTYWNGTVATVLLTIINFEAGDKVLQFIQAVINGDEEEELPDEEAEKEEPETSESEDSDSGSGNGNDGGSEDSQQNDSEQPSDDSGNGTGDEGGETDAVEEPQPAEPEAEDTTVGCMIKPYCGGNNIIQPHST